MRTKISWLIFSLLFANYASAAWQIVRETKEGIYYIDPDSIEKNGEQVKAISFKDFHQMQNRADKSFLSAKFKNEYDCKKNQFRQLEMMLYPENMANGELLLAEKEPQNWIAPQTGSIEELLLRTACKK